ncbi:MAG TPA: SRPBCC family protein [Polyangiaceae bacterium]|nr:SRPBCC family protein [Polyangiaceae bacterium]
MDARKEIEPTPMKNRTTVERTSEREVVVRRTFDAPARLVFEAWTKPELIKRWWVPKSMGMSLLSHEADVRTGGSYRFVFAHGASEPMAFFGRYLEVTPHSRIVWTNDEGGEGGSVTTATFEETGGKTLLVLRDLYPSKEALDAAGTGFADAMHETFEQLDELLVDLGASVSADRDLISA